MSYDRQLQTNPSGWRTRIILAGGIVGSLVGVGAAYLYTRAAEEASADGELKGMATADVVKIGIGLVALIRQIADMGTRK